MTQEPLPIDPERELARQYGDLAGTLDGRRSALDEVKTRAYLNAFHAEQKAAGLCRCEEIAAAQTSTPPVDLQALSDRLGGLVTELGRIARTLQPKPAEMRLRPIVAPELTREVDAILGSLGERARARREAQAEHAAGELVDADETPAAPTQQALDDDPIPQLAQGGIVRPGPLLDTTGHHWAPQCAYGCDNEAQHPDCALHSPAGSR